MQPNEFPSPEWITIVTHMYLLKLNVLSTQELFIQVPVRQTKIQKGIWQKQERMNKIRSQGSSTSNTTDLHLQVSGVGLSLIFFL